VSAIVLWNSVFLERAVDVIRQSRQTVSNEVLSHFSPLKWEHINFTGHCHRREDAGIRNCKLRPLRTSKQSLTPLTCNF